MNYSSLRLWTRVTLETRHARRAAALPDPRDQKPDAQPLFALKAGAEGAGTDRLSTDPQTHTPASVHLPAAGVGWTVWG